MYIMLIDIQCSNQLEADIALFSFNKFIVYERGVREVNMEWH